MVDQIAVIIKVAIRIPKDNPYHLIFVHIFTFDMNQSDNAIGLRNSFPELSMFNLNFFFDFLDKKLCYTQIPTKEKYLLSVM